MSEYLVVIEQADGNYSAYAPDLVGCVATGKTLAQVKERMREAILLHVQGLKEDGLPVPPAASRSEYVTVGI